MSLRQRYKPRTAITSRRLMAPSSQLRRATQIANARARRVVPGYTRTGGYYGRTSGDSETKFFDTDVDDDFIATAGTIFDSINKIPQGTTENSRVGRKCTLKAIQWKYDIKFIEIDAQATPSNPDTVRVILYQDMQCNGATAAVTDILETADYQSFYNLANIGRFKILMDKTTNHHVLALGSDGAGLISSPGNIKSFTFYKKCNIPLEFNSTAGAITEIRSNNIGVLLISAENVCEFDSKFRLRYVG